MRDSRTARHTDATRHTDVTYRTGTTLRANVMRRMNAARRLPHRIGRRCRRPVFSNVSPVGWMAVLLATMSAAAFVPLGWHELLAIAIAATSMLVAAVALSLGNTAFSATVEVSERHVAIADTVHIQVTVRNDGHASTVPASGVLPIGTGHERFAIPALATGQTKRIDLAFTAVARAALPIGPLSLRKGDPFGLVRRERRLTERTNAFIHPRTIALAPLDAGIPRDLEGRPSGTIVDDDLDFHGLREYEPGDDMRNAHWLSSAKTGALMIRQYEATRRTDTTLAISVNPHDYANAEEFELAVSVHASIGVRCLSQNHPVTVHAGRRHASPNGPMEFLDMCSAIEPDSDDEPNLVRGILADAAGSSRWFITVGRNRSVEDARRMALALPRGTTCVVLRADVRGERSITRHAGFVVATIGDLDDLPTIMGMLA